MLERFSSIEVPCECLVLDTFLGALCLYQYTCMLCCSKKFIWYMSIIHTDKTYCTHTRTHLCAHARVHAHTLNQPVQSKIYFCRYQFVYLSAFRWHIVSGSDHISVDSQLVGPCQQKHLMKMSLYLEITYCTSMYIIPKFCTETKPLALADVQICILLVFFF